MSAKCKILNLECNINNYSDLPEDTLGQRLYRLRMINHINKKELSEISNISDTTIYNIEERGVTPNISTIVSLSKALSTTNYYLLGLKDWPEDNPGQIIKKYRLSKGLIQRQLANLCGLHNSTIKDYEDNRIKGKTRTLDLVYKILGYK